MTRPYELEKDNAGVIPVAQIENEAGTASMPWKGEDNAGWMLIKGYPSGYENEEGILFASEARTASVESDDQENLYHKGIHVILDVTDSSDTPSIVLKIQGKDAAGNYYDLLESAAVTGAGSYVYKVMPWIAEVANESVADLLPKTWRVIVTHADADSITYSVCYSKG
jgi:hypothetical protein